MYVSVFGVDAITYDEATSLEWLDVTASVDRSYDDMAGNDGSNEFLPGGDFEGWRYATTDEWTEFLSHAGIAPLPSTTGVPISGFRCFRSPHRLKESGSLRSFELFEGLLQLLFPQQLRLGKVWGIRERT